MTKNILLIGFGSIAQKYYKILLKKNFRIYCYVKNHSIKLPKQLHRIKSLDSLSNIKYAIICTPTNSHLTYAIKLITQKIPVLIEKPISDKFNNKINELINLAKQNNTFFMVGYNHRFLPINNKIKNYIESNKLGKILFASLYVGQYLPNWRPNRKYEEIYSSQYNKGGGAALDLIHEIDLGYHWFTNLTKNKINSYKLSNLKIDCEDFVQITFNKDSIIQITMDYLNHIKTRKYIIIGTKGSITCDIYNKYFEFKSADNKTKKINQNKFFDLDNAFKQQLDFFIISAKNKSINLLNNRFLGIDALQTAIKARKYVPRI